MIMRGRVEKHFSTMQHAREADEIFSLNSLPLSRLLMNI